MKQSFVLVLLTSLKTLTGVRYKLITADTRRDKCFENQPKYTESSPQHKPISNQICLSLFFYRFWLHYWTVKY